MARKLRRGYPLQIYGVISGSIPYCDDILKKRIDEYIKKHNELYPKRSAWLRHGIKAYEISQYNATLSSSQKDMYMISYIVNFYR